MFKILHRTSVPLWFISKRSSPCLSVSVVINEKLFSVPSVVKTSKIIMKLRLTFFLALILLLAACTSNPPASVTPTSPSSPTASAATPATPTPGVPTATTAPGKVLFVTPNADAAQAAAVRSQVLGLASTANMVVQDLAALQVSDLSADVRIVVLLSVPANLDELLAAAPKVQFVVLGDSALQPLPNLSLIQESPENAAYLAGFIATIISPDWRSAGLLPDSPAGLAEAFQNGGRYYCGRCTSLHGPVTAFPLATALPAGSSLSAWQDGLAQMQQKILETLYIDPAISSPDLLALVAGQSLVLVGGQAPSEDLRPRWAATISADLLGPLQTLWPDLLAGKGGKTIPAALQISDANENLLTPGKQRLAQDVITGLQDGTIAPLSPPLQ